MGFNIYFVPLYLLLVSILPAYIALRLEPKKRSTKIINSTIVFMLGIFTCVGGWLYLAFLNYGISKKSAAIKQ